MSDTGNGYSGGSSGRVTMKDVYDVVGRLETKVDGLGSSMQQVTVDHEHRLTEQATLQAGTQQQVDRLTDSVQLLRDEHNVARGHVRSITWIAGALGTTFCGLGAYGLAHVLHW